MEAPNLRLIQTQTDKGERRRRLAQAYAAILAWPDPQFPQNELAAESLGRTPATSSTSETPINPDALFNFSTETVQDVELASDIDQKKTKGRGLYGKETH